MENKEFYIAKNNREEIIANSEPQSEGCLTENDRIEFKESWRKKECLQALCAFANTDGGSLYIGVKDDGQIIGIKKQENPQTPNDITKTTEDISNEIIQALNGAIPEIRPISFEKKLIGKYIICIKVEKRNYAVYYKGRCYKRSGATTQQLKGKELDDFLDKTPRIPSDSSVLKNIRLKDLDIKLFREKIRLDNRHSELLDLKKKELAENLNLIKDGKYTRAGVLLFHKNPCQNTEPKSPCMIGACIKIYVDTKDKGYVEESPLKGNLFDQIDQTISYISKHSDWKITDSNSLNQENQLMPDSSQSNSKLKIKPLPQSKTYNKTDVIPEIPKHELKDALCAAVILKDYSLSAPIKINISKEKISLTAPNYEYKDPSQLLKEPDSHNPLLTKAFQETGFDNINWIRKINEKKFSNWSLKINEKGFFIEFDPVSSRKRTDYPFKNPIVRIRQNKFLPVAFPVAVMALIFAFVTISQSNKIGKLNERIGENKEQIGQVEPKIGELSNSIDENETQINQLKKNEKRDLANVNKNKTYILLFRDLFKVCLNKTDSAQYENCLKRINDEIDKTLNN